MTENSKIAIIGAGVSGLAAAVRLIDAGIQNITIFEARRTAGGRTRSYVDPTTGDTLDNGQHLLMGCYTSTLDYLERIGTLSLIERSSLAVPFHAAHRSSPDILRVPKHLPPRLSLLAGLWSTTLLSFREKLAATQFGNAIAQSKLPVGLESMTCHDLFMALSQPKGLVAKLWTPITLATINAPVESASAVLFVKVVREVFFSPLGSTILFPQCGLSELLIDPAIRKIQDAQAEIRLSEPVRNIEVSGGGFEIMTEDGLSSYNSVIWTTASRDPLPTQLQQVIPEWSYSPIVNAYFWLDRPALISPIHAFVGTTLQWAFVQKSVFAAERLGLTVSAANGIVEKINEEIRDILWTDLQNALPAMRSAQLLHWQIIREKRATPLFTPYFQEARPLPNRSMNNFFLAGDNVQNGLPATIEGAVRNGYNAAELLLRMHQC